MQKSNALPKPVIFIGSTTLLTFVVMFILHSAYVVALIAPDGGPQKPQASPTAIPRPKCPDPTVQGVPKWEDFIKTIQNPGTATWSYSDLIMVTKMVENANPTGNILYIAVHQYGQIMTRAVSLVRITTPGGVYNLPIEAASRFNAPFQRLVQWTREGKFQTISEFEEKFGCTAP